MISDTKATIGETFTVSETAAYLGVSPRTVERYAAVRSYKPLSEVRNGRKVNVYEKEWMDKHFTPVGHAATQRDAKVSDKAPEGMDKRLLGEIDYLKQEIEVKNQVINKLQDSQSRLIESERNTKTLLADLQFQNKTLLLKAPTKIVKEEGKESSVWTWIGFSLLAAMLIAGYFVAVYIHSFFH